MKGIVRREAAAALLCALVFLQVTPVLAVRTTVYFVAADENVLPLTEETMPFWSGGYLYVSTSIFTGLGKEALGLSRMQDPSTGLVMVYQGTRKYLLFEPGNSFCRDGDGNPYYPGAVRRNGDIFVPAQTIAKFFDLQFSLTEVEHGYLVWLRHADFQLPEQVFADAASFHLKNRYREYLKSLEPEPEPEPEPPAVQTPAAPQIQEETPQVHKQTPQVQEPEKEAGGQNVYLCLRAGEESPAVLDVLERRRAHSALFCTAEFAEREGDLLRRMASSGQGIGLLADGSLTDRTVEEQLEAGNKALERAVCRKTRLALVENAGEADLRAAREAGYCCLQPDLDRSGEALGTSAQADALLSAVSRRGGNVSVWLGDGAQSAGLDAFLSGAAAVGNTCLALTETSFT